MKKFGKLWEMIDAPTRRKMLTLSCQLARSRRENKYAA